MNRGNWLYQTAAVAAAGLSFGLWQGSAWAALTMFSVLYLVADVIGTNVTIMVGDDRRPGEE